MFIHCLIDKYEEPSTGRWRGYRAGPAPFRPMGERRRAVDDRVATSLRPTNPVRFPRRKDGLEYATRSMIWAPRGESIWRAWGPPENPWPLGVAVRGTRWRVEAEGVDRATAREAARQLFSLEHDLPSFYRQVRNEPVLRGCERRFRGLRLPRDPTLYDALLNAVIGQQLSVSAANSLRARLLEATDAFLQFEGMRLPHAPSPRSLNRLGVDGMRRVGLSRAKSAALLHLAKGQAEGRFSSLEFRDLSSEAAIERLDVEPGIGRWTAENALLRGVGRTDLFVAGDLGLRVALAEYGVLPRHAPEEAARAWAEEHYPGWGSYATVYLWKKLVTETREGVG